jgi:hypothetical protein
LVHKWRENSNLTFSRQFTVDFHVVFGDAFAVPLPLAFALAPGVPLPLAVQLANAGDGAESILLGTDHFIFAVTVGKVSIAFSAHPAYTLTSITAKVLTDHALGRDKFLEFTRHIPVVILPLDLGHLSPNDLSDFKFIKPLGNIVREIKFFFRTPALVILVADT